MNKSPVPAETARAERRRRQILDAATRCFALRGFHATSIAQIGAEAGMSVGHIYRYFTNKEAIIAGIVRSNLDDAQAFVNDITAQSTDLQTALLESAERGVDKALDYRQSVLMIEVKAEAARNPTLAAILHAADTEMRQHLTGLLRQAQPGGWSEDDIAMRAEIMALTFEGLPLRAIANPTLGRAGMVRLMQMIIRQLLA